MSAKTKAQLLDEIEDLQKRLAELQAVKAEPHQKNDIFKRQAHALGERVKELDCLYGLSSLVETTGISLAEIFQGCAELLLPAGQYPQITCARITLGGREYKTGNFRETKWKLASVIKVEGKRSGLVDVFYLGEQPKSDRGPFLKEEQVLIDAVAERLGRIIQQVQAQERIKHLTLVLRAIRNVNQLIIREKNRDVLIQEICDNLTETRGYATAWIILLDERGEYLDSAEAGLGKGFTPLLKELKHGDFPACVQQARAQSGPVEINDPSATCADCPITEKYSDKGRMAIRLEHAENIYGILSVSFGVDITVDEEELSLFKEVAGDIAFALFSIELEEKRGQAEKELKNSELYITNVFDAIQNGISILDTDLIITGTNKWMEEMYSDKMPLAGKKCYQVYQGRKTICPWCPSIQTLEDGKQHVAMVPYPNEEEPARWIELLSYPLVDTNGEINGVIESVQDITERVQARREIETLLNLSRKAGTETNLNDLLFSIANQIVEIIPPAEAASIFLHDEKRKVVRVQAWAGFNDSEIKELEFPINESQVGKIFQFKKPSLIQNTSEDPDFELIDKPSLKTTKSQMAVPLIYKKRVFGIIFADNLTRTDAFSRKDLNLLESIGNQLAGVIENTRLLDQVRGSEERFRAFMEHVPAFAYILNKDLHYIYGNPASIAADGFSTLEDYYGTSIQNDYPDEISNEIEANNKRVLEEGCITNHEFSVVMQDGKNHALLDIKFPIQLSDGNTQVGGLSIDVTEMKEAQRSILEERDKAQKYLDIAEVMIVALNKEGEITLVNQKGASILGYTVEDLTEKNWFDICLPAADRVQAEKVFNDFIAGEVGWGEHFEQTIVTKMGKERIVDWYSTPLWEWVNGEKHRIGSLSSGEDITERVQALKKLQESEKYQKTIFETTSLATIILEEDTTISMVNKEFEKLSGYSKEELEGKMSWTVFVAEEDLKRMQEYHQQRRIDPDATIKQYEFRFINREGIVRNILINVDLIPGTKNSVVSFLDITERKRAEQLLDALNRAAVAMGPAKTQEEIFNVVSEELKQLDISCMLFPLDETRSRLITKFISYESVLLNAAEKLAGIKHGNFSFPIGEVDIYKEVIREKKTLFSDNSERSFQQILPKLPKKAIAQILKLLHVQKSISAPLVVEDQIIGVFSIQSDTLTQEDVSAATAFADQLSSAWNKIKLLNDLRKTVEGTIHAIAATVEARDPYTAGHQGRVADLAAAIASEMHLSKDQVEGIKMAGIIHDLGKINVPAEILSKPGKISELEYKIIQTHPQVGFDLLKTIEFPWPIAEMVLQHHEKMDGSGYPQGLKGDEILIEARILCIADIVEAMASHRPYRPSLGIEKALSQIKKDRGALLDPMAVDACLKIFKEGYKLLEN